MACVPHHSTHTFLLPLSLSLISNSCLEIPLQLWPAVALLIAANWSNLHSVLYCALDKRVCVIMRYDFVLLRRLPVCQWSCLAWLYQWLTSCCHSRGKRLSAGRQFLDPGYRSPGGLQELPTSCASLRVPILRKKTFFACSLWRGKFVFIAAVMKQITVHV